MKFHGGVEWTAEMMEAFEALSKDHNISYQEMANRLSAQFGVTLTKNACVGKGRRMGLVNRRPTRWVAPRPKPAVPRVRKMVATAPVNIYQLETGCCKWPLAKLHDLPPFMYCGKPTELGRSWCTTHQKMAYSLRKVG